MEAILGTWTTGQRLQKKKILVSKRKPENLLWQSREKTFYSFVTSACQFARPRKTAVFSVD